MIINFFFFFLPFFLVFPPIFWCLTSAPWSPKHFENSKKNFFFCFFFLSKNLVVLELYVHIYILKPHNSNNAIFGQSQLQWLSGNLRSHQIPVSEQYARGWFPLCGESEVTVNVKKTSTSVTQCWSRRWGGHWTCRLHHLALPHCQPIYTLHRNLLDFLCTSDREIQRGAEGGGPTGEEKKKKSNIGPYDLLPVPLSPLLLSLALKFPTGLEQW